MTTEFVESTESTDSIRNHIEYYPKSQSQKSSQKCSNIHLFRLFDKVCELSNTSQNRLSIVNVSNNLKKILAEKLYLCHDSLSNLTFDLSDDFVIVSSGEINDNLRHIDHDLDRVLHQTKVVVFERSSCLPIFYLEKTIKESDTNSYLKNYVYDKIKYQTEEFDTKKIFIHKHYIGTFIVLFHLESKDKWYFFLNNKVYEFNRNTHPLLYEHIGSYIVRFNTDMCYHLVLVDSRIRKLITPTCETNHVVLVNLTNKYSLEETVSNHTDYDGVFLDDKRIYFSCLDELNVRLEEADVVNLKAKKLLNRGFIVKIDIGESEKLSISYDTYTYKHLNSLIPANLGIHSAYLCLYQQDKLNYFLQYVTDSYVDMVKRINTSMSTMSREILDIYHMTRNKKNSELYKILPQTYRHMLYQLHSDYIVQKVQKTDDYNYDYENLEINGDEKVSITVDNVYTKLKELDIHILIELYKDRDELIVSINNDKSNEIINPVKMCVSTLIQSKLLSI